MRILLGYFLFFNSKFKKMIILLMVKMHQVHGNNVVRVAKKDDGKTIKNCDAMITNENNIELCVRVADCLPIFVRDKKGRGIGLIHAGWRGLENKIISKTIKKMVSEFSLEPSELDIGIGPHICKKHYEVKGAVSAKFGGVKFLDLAQVAKEELISLGVKSKDITIDKTCTYENENLFSYRRSGTSKGNLFTLDV